MKNLFLFLIECGSFWTHESNNTRGMGLKFEPAPPAGFIKQALEAWFSTLEAVGCGLEVEFSGFGLSERERPNPRRGGADEFWVPQWHFRKTIKRLSSSEDEPYSEKEVTIWTVASLLNGQIQVWKQTWIETENDPGDEPEHSETEYSDYVVEDEENIFI